MGQKEKRIALAVQPSFKWRHFEAEMMLLCVRWYLRSALSYRDLEEMMLERGLHVDHTTIFRWVQQYAPELESVVVRISKRQPTPGAWMRRTSRSRAYGCICIGQSIRKAKRLNFSLAPHAMHKLPSA